MQKRNGKSGRPARTPGLWERLAAGLRALVVLGVGASVAGAASLAVGAVLFDRLSSPGDGKGSEKETTAPAITGPSLNAGPRLNAQYPERVPSLENATCETDRPLSLSDPPTRGEDVRELKIRLVQLGYFEGPTDDVYDAATARAVVEFQKAENLSANGVVTAEVWDALGRGVETEAHPAERTEPPRGELFLVVDLDRRTLTLYADGKPYKTYPVAVGKWETPSPVGEWRVVYKAKNWGGGFGPRWLGIDVPWGIYGIHGTNKPWSIGQSISGGCLRMPNECVIELWDWTPEDSRVFIVGEVPRPEFILPQRFGSAGQDVVYTQLALRERGFDPGQADGRFGPQTERAVRDLQVFYGLPETGVVTQDIYYLLGLR